MQYYQQQSLQFEVCCASGLKGVRVVFKHISLNLYFYYQPQTDKSDRFKTQNKLPQVCPVWTLLNKVGGRHALNGSSSISRKIIQPQTMMTWLSAINDHDFVWYEIYEKNIWRTNFVGLLLSDKSPDWWGRVGAMLSGHRRESSRLSTIRLWRSHHKLLTPRMSRECTLHVMLLTLGCSSRSAFKSQISEARCHSTNRSELQIMLHVIDSFLELNPKLGHF